MNNILIIEDDKTLADGLVRALSSKQNAAESCGCIRSARQMMIAKNKANGDYAKFNEIVCAFVVR